jgi:predicted dehydrogenase
MSENGRSAEEALAIVRTTPPSQGETMIGVPFEKLDVVRFGFIGVGGRGVGQMNEVLPIQGTEVTAVSDVAAAAIQRALDCVQKTGRALPAVETDWRRLCDRNDVDVVYICSPWNEHVTQALWAMECGKHVAVEVPAATTLADCWRLVDTSERTRRHCVMLENCCYGQTELLAFNMVHAGLLGTVTHGEAAYIHDLRELLMADQGEGLWRREPHTTRNGNHYPTHGLGPVAWYMDINRGDRFARLVSMSSLAASLAEYRDARVPAGDPKRKETYRCGDINTSLIQTTRGRTIMLQHDVVSPRPSTRINLVTGSKGAFWDGRVFLDLQGVQSYPGWEPVDEALKARYEHPYWKAFGEQARKLGGHGGMDFIMNYRLVQLFRQGLPPDMDVYDAAAWSAPGPLSEISVAWEGLPLPFPDFTRGRWKERRLPLADTRDLKGGLKLRSVLPSKKLKAKLFKDKNILSAYRLAGPFEGKGKYREGFGGLMPVHPPEKKINLKQAFAGKGGRKIRWKKIGLKDMEADGFVDLMKLLGKVEFAIGYACVEMEAEADCCARLLVGSDDGIAVWLNRKKVLAVDTVRGAAWDQNSADLSLKRGHNELLFKISQRRGEWGFYARLDKWPPGLTVGDARYAT